ncbi:MAG: cytochrome b [Beijerinckiaceae bacterium]|nr:cytochrome b [Beijerinckiaceae bacterium]
MSINDSALATSDYSSWSKALHWITALMILFIIPAGIVMTNIGEGSLQNNLYNLHRSFGVFVFAIALARVLIRISHGAPGPAAGLTAFERFASAFVHYAMYVLLFAMPIVGWLMTSAYRVDVSVFGLFTLPHLIAQNDENFKLLQQMHFIGAISLTLLVLMHIGATIKHTFINKDIVLWRMLPKSWGG